MKQDKLLLLLLLFVSLAGTLVSVMYVNRRISSLEAKISQLDAVESISVQDIPGISDPFDQFQDVFDLQEDLHQRIQTQRIIPGQGSVSAIQQSTVVDGKSLSYTLVVSDATVSGTIEVGDDSLKDLLIQEFAKKTIDLTESSDGTLNFEVTVDLLGEVQSILQTETFGDDILES